MNILVLFTYKVSVKDWNEAGIINREFELYKNLNKTNKFNYSFITYGDENDLIYNLDEFSILPLYSKIKFSKSGIGNFYNSLRIIKIFKKEFQNADIIKTNQLNGAWVAVIAKIIYKKKLLIRTGYDLYYFSIKENKPLMKRYFFYLLTKLALYFSDYYVVSTSIDKARLVSRFGKRYNSKIKVNSNWVMTFEDVIPFHERKDQFISVGRLEEQKNYQNLVELFSKTKYKLIIYGDGSEKDLIEEKARRLGSQLELKGSFDHKELLKEYEKYKYFVLNSHYEGNPKVVMEAMSAGCVVILRHHENNEEIITSGENGIFYYKDEELLEVLNKIDQLNMKKISDNARSYVKENHLIEKHIKNEAELYKKLTSSNTL